MNTKRSIKWGLITAAVTCGAMLAAGCELIVDFDRSKIPQEGGLEDATLDGESDSMPSGDSTSPEASGGDSSTSSDSSTTSDSSSTDSGTTSDSSSTDSGTHVDSSTGDSGTTTTDGGDAGLLANGATCTVGTACASGACVTDDTNTSVKVCCATSCTAAGVASCGLDGNCEHNGSACADYASGTVCAAAACTDGANSSSESASSTCSGAGVCNAGASTSCGTYKCNGVVCASTCTSDSNCATGNYCNGSSACVSQLSAGTSCAANDQCVSPHVCNVNCCTSSTACAAASCNTGTNVFTPASNCDNSGACTSPAGAACANGLICASSTACATTCSAGTTAGCADTVNTTCNSGGTACLLNSGQPCTTGTQCLSGVCTGGTTCQ